MVSRQLRQMARGPPRWRKIRAASQMGTDGSDDAGGVCRPCIGNPLALSGFWRLSVRTFSGDGGSAIATESSGFYKGRWPVRLLADRAGFCLPRLARFGPSRGFPCQIRCGPGTSWLKAAQLFAFAPADRRWSGRSGSASVSVGQDAEAAARAAQRAALKPYRKFSHGERWHAMRPRPESPWLAFKGAVKR